jgi:hypothetical protein
MSHKPDYSDPPYFGEPDDDEFEPIRDAEMEALQADYPGDFVSRVRILTPSGNWIEAIAHHGDEVGTLLATLCCVTGPKNELERDAMAALQKALTS